MLPKETIVAERLYEVRGRPGAVSIVLSSQVDWSNAPGPRHNLVAFALLVTSVPSRVPGGEPNLSHTVSILFPMFPVFLVADDMATKTAFHL
jgi:hypothetical protein